MGMKRTRGTWLIALAIAVATAAAYLPVLDNGFVNYDDDLYIVNNPHVKRGLGTETVAWAFTTFRGANWFPLTWLSWAVDFALYDGDPAGFHPTSLILHVANAVLLFFAFERLTGARWRSAFVAAVFALHPLHVESVAWAAARKDVLSGLFAVLALLVTACVSVEPVRPGDANLVVRVDDLASFGLMLRRSHPIQRCPGQHIHRLYLRVAHHETPHRTGGHRRLHRQGHR